MPTLKHIAQPTSENRVVISNVLAAYRPILGDENMARREFQCPSVLTRQGKFGPEYYIRYRVKVVRMVDGKAVEKKREKWHFIGLCSKMTKFKAKEKRDEIMREVNGQVYSIQSQIPFADFVKIYRERWMPQLRTTTQKTYGGILKKFIEPYFAGKKLCDIRPEHIHQFVTGLQVAPLKRKTVRGLLSGIWNLAIHWGYWKEQSPVKMAFLAYDLPDTRVREKRIWTPAELQKILLSVRPDVRLMIETLVWTGMRISECLGLRWKNVNLEAGYVRIEERCSRGDIGAPKSPKSRRTLPIGTLARKFQALAGAKEADSFVFAQLGSDGKTPYVDCELLANYLTPILKTLDLKFAGAGFHTFRKMHLTWFSEAGATAFEAQQQAGHSSMETTLLYVLPDIRRRAAVVESMQASFSELCGIDGKSGGAGGTEWKC